MSKHRLTIVDVFLLLLLILVTATATSAAGSAPLKKHQPKPCTRPNETALYYRGDGTYLGRIYEALTTCPNITSLDLDFVWSGCIPPEDPWAFTFREGDKFPNLRKLGLYVIIRCPPCYFAFSIFVCASFKHILWRCLIRWSL